MIDAAIRALVIEAVAEATRPLVAEVRALRQTIAASSSRWVTRPVAAEALGVSLDTVDRRIGDGTLRARRMGRAVRVLLDQAAPDHEIARLATEARQ